jgi:hypothetical protein
MNADRGMNTPATRWKGFALMWDEIFSEKLAKDGLHLVAGSFTARSASEEHRYITKKLLLPQTKGLLYGNKEVHLLSRGRNVDRMVGGIS